MKHLFATGALALSLFGVAAAAAQHRYNKGMPLDQQYKIAPNLSVKRRNAIDTWVSLCTV